MSLYPVCSLWVGSHLPAAQQACIASFLRVGHPFELFTYEDVEGIPPGTRIRPGTDILARDRIFKYGDAAGPAAGGFSGFANLFRYALLVKVGGCWVDTDEFCLRPFPDRPLIISSEWRRDGEPTPNCGVLRFPPGHPFPRFCLEQANAADSATLKFSRTGPALVKRAVSELGLEGIVMSPEAFCPVNWFHAEALLEPGVLTEHAYGVHLWSELFRRKGEAIPWPGPPGSVMHMLAQQEVLSGSQ